MPAESPEGDSDETPPSGGDVASRPANGRAQDSDDLSSRPAFATAFPNDPALDALVEAFQNGHFAKVRSEAPVLAEQTESEAVRAAALELRRRIEPSKVATLLWCIGVMLLVALYAFYWAKQHG